MKRLFLAIPIPETIKAEIARFQSSIDTPLKWISEEKLHITIHFFGNIEDSLLPQIKKTIKSITDKTPGFTLELNSFVSKSSKFQSMIWGGFSESTSFITLATQIAKSMGAEKVRKPLPHINLVRCKSKIKMKELPLRLPQTFPIEVTSIELWESKLSPKGATYSSLKSFILHG
jgi:2'-5' RNA ligase